MADLSFLPDADDQQTNLLEDEEVVAETPSSDLSFIPDNDPVKAEVETNFNVTRGANPEQAAQVHELAKKSGLPAPVVESAMDDVKEKVERPKFDVLSRGMMQYYRNPENVKISRDDHGPLDYISKLWDDMKASWERGSEGVVDLGDLYYKKYILGNESPELNSRINELEQKYGTPEEERDDLLGYIATSGAEMAPIMLETIKGGAETGMEGAMMGAMVGAGAAALTGPAAPATIGPALATGFSVGMSTGFAVGAAREIFELESGHAAKEFISITDENGQPIDPLIARTAAMVVGTINAGLEYVGTKEILRLIPAGERITRRAVQSAVKEAVKTRSVREALLGVSKKLASAVTTETLTEATQEAVTIMGGEIAKNLDENIRGTYFADADMGEAAQRIVDAGKKAAAATLGIGGSTASVSATLAVRDAKKARAFYTGQVRVNEAVNESATKERSPDKMVEFLDLIGLGEEVYVSGAVALELYQSDPTIFDQVNIPLNAIQEAVSTGQDLRIKNSELHARLDPDQYKKVAEVMKAAPSGLSLRELQSIDVNKEITHAAEAYEAAVATENEFQAELKRIKQEIIQTGRPEEEADSYTYSVLEPFARRTLAREGVSLAEFARKLYFQYAERTEAEKGALTKESQIFGAALDQIGGVSREELGRLLASGDLTALDHVRKAVEQHGVIPVEDAVRNESLKAVMESADREGAKTNIKNIEPQLAQIFKDAEAKEFAQEGAISILDHYSGTADLNYLDPAFQGTRLPGREFTAIGAQQRPQRIHYYEAGSQPERQFTNLNRYRVLARKPIYDLDADPARYTEQFSREEYADPQERLALIENQIFADGFSGMKSENVTTLFESAQAFPMRRYVLSISPETVTGITGGIEKVTLYLREILDHPLIDIRSLRPAERRFKGGKEFSFDVDIDAGDPAILRGRVAAFLKRYDQYEGYISEAQGAANAYRPTGLDKNQAESYVLRVNRDVTEEDLARVSDTLDSHGIGSWKYVPENGLIVIHHIQKYTGKDEFRKAARAGIKAIKQQFGAKNVDVVRRWFTHDILEAGADRRGYNAVIGEGIQRSDALDIPAVPTVAQGGMRHGGKAFAWQSDAYTDEVATVAPERRALVSRAADTGTLTRDRIKYMPRSTVEAWLKLGYKLEEGLDLDEFYQMDPLGFYLATARAVESMDFKTIPAKNLAERLRKLGGIKAEELEWTGILDWLDGIGDTKVSKQAILDMLNEKKTTLFDLTEYTLRPELTLNWREPVLIEPSSEHITEAAWEAAHNDERLRDQIKERFIEEGRVHADDVAAYVEENGVEPESIFDEDDITDAAQEYVEENFESFTIYSDFADREYKYSLPDGSSGRYRIVGHEDNGFRVVHPDGYELGHVYHYLENAQEKVLSLEIGGVEASDDVAQYAAYAEGDVNYREVLLVIPEPPAGKYESSHWQNYENVLVHFRLSDDKRYIPKEIISGGNWQNTLFIEEVQSDWHQEGRKEGYVTAEFQNAQLQYEALGMQQSQIFARYLRESKPLFEEFSDALGAATEKQKADAEYIALEKRKDEILTQYPELNDPSYIPDVPFKNTEAWAMLAFKRVLNMAVTEGGYTAITWTSGDMQNRRYDLAKFVSAIEYAPESNELRAFDHLKRKSIDRVVEPEKLADVVGKEVAEKLLVADRFAVSTDGRVYEKTFHRLAGPDLSIGGEGMRGFYDRMLPTAVQKYIKKLDPTVKVQPLGDRWFMPITEAVREKVLEGQSLWEGQKRAKMTVIDGKYIISVFRNANASSIPHELAHVFLEEIRNIVISGNASRVMIRDWGSIQKWLQVKADEGIQREQHEKFAQGFEAYLMEGRAPAEELVGAFERFRKWLLDVYKDAVALGVNLTDEMRVVFDRMLATEDQIIRAAASAELTQRTISEMDALQIDQPDRDYMNRLLADGHRKAEARMHMAKNREMRRFKKQWKAEAQIQIETEPVYQLRDDLYKNTGLDRDMLLADYGENVVAAIRKLNVRYVTQDGRAPGSVAMEFGYADAEDMVAALLESVSKNDRIKQIVAEKLAAHDTEFNAEDYLVDTDEIAEYMRLVSFYSARLKKLGTPPHQQALKKYAERNLMAKTVREATRVDRYLAAVKSAARESRAYMLKGDVARATKANDRARLNLEFAKAARHLKDFVDKTVRDTASTARMKVKKGQRARIEGNYHENIKSLANRYGIVDVAVNPNKKPLSVLLAPPEDPLLDMGTFFSDWLTGEQDSRSYQNLTVEEFQELASLLQHLQGKGREIVKDYIVHTKMSAKDTAQTCAAAAKDLKNKIPWGTDTAIGRAIHDAREYFANTDMLLFVMRRMDAFSNVGPEGVVGPNERYNYLPLADAWSRRLELLEDVKNRLQGPINQLMESLRKHPRKLQNVGVAVPEIMARKKQDWTYERVLAVALNMGNVTNRKRVMEGYGLTEADLNRLTGPDIISNDDWVAVQAIWDLIDSLWPAANEEFYKMNLTYQKKVEADPFVTASGMQMRGGYYPIKFDSQLTKRQAAREEQLEIMNSVHAMFPTPAVFAGMMKSRAASAGGMPVKLSLSVLAQHLDFMTHYITHARLLRDIDRVMQRAEYQRMVEDKLGEEVYNLLRPTLKHIANSHAETYDIMDKWLDKHRALATAYQLGANTSVALKQPYSIFGYIEDEGFETYMRGLANMAKSPRKAITTTYKLSAYMRQRGVLVEREIKDAVRRFSLQEKTIAGVSRTSVRNAMFILIRAMDYAAVYPAWWSSFNKGMSLYEGDIAAAVRHADEAIAASQPSSRPMDLSHFQRSPKAMNRLFTMFSTFTMKYGNRQRYFYGAWRAGKLSNLRYMKWIIVESILPPLLMHMMFNAIWGREMDDEDLKDTGWDILLYQVIGFPFFRDMINGITAYTRGKYVGDPFDSPAFIGGEIFMKFMVALQKWVEDLDDDERWKKAAWTFADMVGYSIGVPAVKVYEKIQRGMEQWEQRGAEPAEALNILIPAPKERR